MTMPLIAIVGRPNVGKSTLFNRLARRTLAIVEDRPGTTRDRVYAHADLEGREVTLVDTGGLEVEPTTEMAQKVKAQVGVALAEADLVLFLVDAVQGITALDRDVAQALRRRRQPIMLVANKADSQSRAQDSVQFYELGLGDPIPVSAYHGMGVSELVEHMLEHLPAQAPEEAPAEGVRLAIVGRPNVGKSLLLNALLGQERAIVSEVPGTTRDALDTPLLYEGQPLVLIDTAGLRRRGRVEVGVEKYSVLRALRAIARADVALLVMEAPEPATAQDAHVVSYILEAYKGLVLVVNKWDLVPPEERDEGRWAQAIWEKFHFLPPSPLLFVSALKGWRLEDILPAALEVALGRSQRVPTGELNRVVAEAMSAHGPPTKAGRSLRILYVTQADVSPPTFVFFVNDPKLLHFSYQRFLENRLRQAFGFSGVSLKLVFRGRERGKGKAWQPSA
ncbi:MAG: ribosome biogenesis GTPase Der [Chloroflexi bacterium]|nr:ribosome biogenesis GTPase Der [Chloroflexota bacterium]